jgi:small subunit ribosomal protein S4e
MVKNHLKAIAAPATWPIERKRRVFVVRPQPGTHSLDNCISLNLLLTDILKLATSKKEVMHILSTKEVMVDGRKVTERSFPVGLLDIISIKDIKKNYRIILDKKGKLRVIEIDEKENAIKPCKIIGKTLVKGKVQLNLYDSRNILVDKDGYKVGDSIVLSADKKKVTDHLKLEKGNTIFLTGGKKIGTVGTVEDIIENKILYRKGEEVFETLKKYAFVIGNNKPLIKIE